MSEKSDLSFHLTKKRQLTDGRASNGQTHITKLSTAWFLDILYLLHTYNDTILTTSPSETVLHNSRILIKF